MWMRVIPANVMVYCCGMRRGGGEKPRGFARMARGVGRVSMWADSLETRFWHPPE